MSHVLGVVEYGKCLEFKPRVGDVHLGRQAQVCLLLPEGQDSTARKLTIPVQRQKNVAVRNIC